MAGIAILKLDTRSYIEAFGGKHRVMKILWRDLKVRVNLKQIEKWIERDSIPGASLVALQILGATLNPAVEVLNYIEISQPDEPYNPKHKRKKNNGT